MECVVRQADISIRRTIPDDLDAIRLAASDAAFAAVAWVTAALSALSAIITWTTIPGSKQTVNPETADR